MICQEDQISSLPFDLKHHGVIPYSAALDRASFSAALEAQLAKVDEKMEDSPVSGFLNSGLSYCIQRALAGRREIKKRLAPFSGIGYGEDALVEIDRINQKWAGQQMQVSVIKDDKLLRHQGGMVVREDANNMLKDVIDNNRTQYPRMKSYGEGLWLGSIEGHVGRLTAIAYEKLGQDWMIAIEAHVWQGEI